MHLFSCTLSFDHQVDGITPEHISAPSEKSIDEDDEWRMMSEPQVLYMNTSFRLGLGLEWRLMSEPKVLYMKFWKQFVLSCFLALLWTHALFLLTALSLSFFSRMLIIHSFLLSFFTHRGVSALLVPWLTSPEVPTKKLLSTNSHLPTPPPMVTHPSTNINKATLRSHFYSSACYICYYICYTLLQATHSIDPYPLLYYPRYRNLPLGRSWSILRG